MKFITNAKGQRVEEYEFSEFAEILKTIQVCNPCSPVVPHEDLNEKTLVIKHTWGIGDTFFLTAAIRALKTKFPKIRIVAAVRYTDLLLGNPDIEEILDYRMAAGTFALAKRYKGRDWRLLDYDCMIKGGYDLRLNGRPSEAHNDFFDYLSEKDVLEPFEETFLRQAPSVLNREWGLSALEIYAAHAGVPLAEKKIFYYPNVIELENAQRFLSTAKFAKKVVLLPQTSTQYKDYPHWPEVIAKSADILWFVIGSPWKEIPKLLNVVDLTEALQLRDAIALTLEADLLCSGDSGIPHVRAAAGKSCLILHGPTEHSAFFSYSPSAEGLRIEKLQNGMCSTGCMVDCIPCVKGSPPAPCLRELDPQVVLSKIREMLR